MSEDEKAAREFFAWCGETAMYTVAMSLMILYRGFVLSYLWAWFITPTTKLHPPGIVMCAGIALTVSCLVHGTGIGSRRDSDDEKKLKYSAWERLGLGVFGHTLILSLGWVTHLFV